MEEPNLGQETRTPSEAAVNNGVKIGTVGPEVLTGSKTIKFEITI